MLSFQEFFIACAGFWKTERTYHFVSENEVERSYTEFRAEMLEQSIKQQILSKSDSGSDPFASIKIDTERAMQDPTASPGFAVSFETRSEKGEEVAMTLNALFIPDAFVTSDATNFPAMPLPAAAEVDMSGEVIQGFYLRDQGYSESGAIAGRFTYQPIRQTLEMTTYYNRSVAVDQMRFVTPTLRLRTIVTYQRPVDGSTPTVITLIGFGMEQKAA
ncbi:MAG: phycobiliprotein lyase [Leptolyngbyaceae cyanobacterium CRU_2_3]|nr:phycobiliprotein lyase [Leptolyngbyaceae cyanobacterium CRU_2_3]